MKLDRFIKKRGLVESTSQLIQISTKNPPVNEKKIFLFLKPILLRMGFHVETFLSPKGRWNIIVERRGWREFKRRAQNVNETLFNVS